MDNTPKPTPAPFTDVARPGATPANPSSRPIITANVPEQKDPMMTTMPVTAAPVTTSTTPVVPNPTPATPMPNTAAASAEPQHKFKHDEGHIGHVGKRPIKKRKFIIGFLIILSLGVAFYIMFVQT